ncbi:MAG TPA: flagellar biosynthesis anti-sigma factor FlgM [Rhizobacter sp.]|nr:flagellar biosynthesis anti-sigma factor FlgM [Rhizobacter sp.]
MKIGNPAEKPAPVPAGTARTQAGETAKANEVAAATDPSAKVELSNAATSLLSGNSSSEFDADKVARIAQAITDGKFKINADAIADKLISNAKEVLGKH